jgi:hypothetical protein
MKKIVEEIEGEGLEKLLGQKVLLMCANYFYTGTLIGVNDTCVLIKDASIVYETGPWTDKLYKDFQKISDEWYVQRSFIESFGVGK